MTIYEFLGRLDGVEGMGGGMWKACCPLHSDSEQRLSVGVSKKGRITLNCSARCSTFKIVQAMGLTLADLDTKRGEEASNFVDNVGFVESQQSENNNGFCDFCYFCGPDLSKNPIFPAEEFSRDLRNFSVWSGSSLQTAVDMPAVSVLAMSSICAQRKFKVHPIARHYEPVNLYTAVVARPSERKSPTLDLAAAPIYEYQRRENGSRRSRVEEYRDKRDMLLRRIENLKKIATNSRKAKGNTTATEEEIRLLRLELEDLEKDAIDYISLTSDDTTMEALASKMAANGEKGALISSEGGIFNILSGLYTGGKLNMDLILKAWSGDHVEVDRKGRPPEVLQHPSLTIHLMVQPKVLEAVMNNVEFAGRGLNARFLYSLPISLVGTRVFDTPDIPQEVIDDYVNLLNRILAIPDTGEPRIIECTDDARDELRKIHDEIEPRLITDLEPMGDWAGKYEGAVIRIAGLLHVCDYVERAAEVPLPGGQPRLGNTSLLTQRLPISSPASWTISLPKTPSTY